MNPRIPDFLRTVTWAECAVLAGAAGLLYLLPKWGGHVGAIYLGALVPLGILAITARWSPGRIVLWMISTFTTAITVVMLASTRASTPRPT